MTVYASIAVYNSMDRPFMLGVASIRRYVDRVVFFDGSWDGKPSTDGTREYIQAWCARDPQLEYVLDGWTNEMGKRQAQVNHGEKGDWIFFIDSDEILECGGAWLRDLVNWPPHKHDSPHEVLIREKTRSFFRANLFPSKFSWGSAPPGTTKLPIMIRHLRLAGGLT